MTIKKHSSSYKTKNEKINKLSPKFPTSWVLTPLSSIIELNKKKPLNDELEVGFTPMADVPTTFKGITKYERRLWKTVKKGYTQFQNNDVIFAKITPCFENSKAAIIKNYPNGYGAGSTEYYVLRPVCNTLESQLLLAFVKSREFLVSGSTNMTGSVGHKRVPKNFVSNYPFPLPPLAEQKEIATRLDKLLTQVDTLKTRLDAIPTLLKRFRQSVLAAAVSGRLLESKRKLKTIQVGQPWMHEVEGLSYWDECIFSDIIKLNGGSQPPKSEFKTEEGKGLIRLIQIRDYKSDAYKVFIPIEKAKKTCSSHDVMIGRYGPPIFQILRGLEGAYNVALMKAEPKNDKLNTDFLYWLLQNYKLQNYIKGGSDRTAGQSGVNKKFLESYPVILPPLKEQTEIVTRVESLFTFADKIEQQVTQAQDRINNLTQSILAKAFRGELTADWRKQYPELISGENSAEALLARIKAEREKLATKPKRKQRSRQ